MQVCVIDGRGGGLGRRLIADLQAIVVPPHGLTALGLNQAAADAMAKAGARRIVVGERIICRTVAQADVILGSLNLLLPGTMLGEVTPGLVQAIVATSARKLLLPVNRSGVEVVGATAPTLEPLIHQACHRVQWLLQQTSLPEDAALASRYSQTTRV